MNIKIALSTATALGLLMGTAYAGEDNWAVVVQGLNGGDGNSASIDQNSGDDNISKLIQDGNNNSASITQDGDANWAGTHLEVDPGNAYDPNEAAVGYNYMTQDGDYNSLTILQTERGNSVAYNGHLVQSGNHNAANITQHGDLSAGNRLNTLLQTDSSGSATSLTNSLTVLQEGAAPGTYPYPPVHPDHYHYPSNLITKVEQTHTGGNPNELQITQTGGTYQAGNTVTLASQNGGGNDGSIYQSGRANMLASMSQNGTGNSADVTQGGTGNNITSVIQDNSAGGAAGNTAVITQTGNGNGVGGFEPWSTAGAVGGDNPLVQGALGYFGITYDGVEQGTATQIGDDNHINYTASGDGNLFGFSQDGGGNSASGTSDGDGNAVAAVQYGDGNTADFGQDGTDNDTGIFQQGNGNTADLTADGNRNHLLSGQYGDGNEATMRVLDGSDNIAIALQAFGNGNTSTIETDNASSNIAVTVQGLGNGNNADIDIEDGDGNIAAAVQLGSGNESSLSIDGGNNFAVTLQAYGPNYATVNISGNGNNQPILASFDGDAATAAGASGTTLGDLSPITLPASIGSLSLMQPGLMTQVGANNHLSMDVSGDNNLFATLQHGDGNQISHTINGSGEGNQAAIVQVGNNNVSSTMQTGSFNNVGISQ